MNRLSSSKIAIAAAVLGFAALLSGLIDVILAFDAPDTADKPNITDWLQGWGNVGGVIAGIAAAVAAAAVYLQGQRALRASETYRAEDRAEAEAAARETERRWQEEKARAQIDALFEKNERREEVAAARKTAEAAEKQLKLQRHRWAIERQYEQLQAPRAVLVVQVEPEMYEPSKLGQISVTVHNYGALPIRRVRATVHLKADDIDLEARASVMGPDKRSTLSDEFRSDPIPISQVRLIPWDLGHDSSIYSVTLRFIDAMSREWERTDNGEPVWTNPPPNYLQTVGSEFR